MTVVKLFGGVADVIAQLDPEKIIGLQASKKVHKRVAELVAKKKEGNILQEEAYELERILSLDLFIGLAKARAHKHLST